MVWLYRKKRQHKLCKDLQFQDASKCVSIHPRGKRYVWRKEVANLSAWARWRKVVDIHPFDRRYAHGGHVIAMMRYLWTSWLSDTLLPHAVDNFHRYILLPTCSERTTPVFSSASHCLRFNALVLLHQRLTICISEDMLPCMCSWGTPIYNGIWWLHLTTLLSEAFSTKALLT